MITCFTPIGYIRFARSLIRFCNMKPVEAMALTNLCARANFDAFRAAPEDSRAGEVKGISFSVWDAGTPYQTEVQLYKSMQILLKNMGDEQSDATSHLHALQNDVSDRFWSSYGVDIEDSCTTYALCESTLEPTSEPSFCLRPDESTDKKQGGTV